MQLHCPPSSVYSSDAVYDALDTLVDEGAIASYGVSVEKAEEALAAIARPNVATVQIILNAFRLRPLDEVLPAAAEAGVGIIARVPLASGLLSGKYDASTTFAPDDHRSYNRDGSAFDVGETFSGVDFATGLAGRRRVRPAGAGARPGRDQRPGCDRLGVRSTPRSPPSSPAPATSSRPGANAAAGDVAPLGQAFDEGVHRIYDTHLREAIHPRW